MPLIGGGVVFEVERVAECVVVEVGGVAAAVAAAYAVDEVAALFLELREGEIGGAWLVVERRASNDSRPHALVREATREAERESESVLQRVRGSRTQFFFRHERERANEREKLLQCNEERERERESERIENSTK